MKFHLELFFVFFRIGLFTLGGGYAMLPLIEREVVDAKRWLDGPDFLASLAVAQSLPGPIAVNTAVFVGHRTRGVTGAVAAVFGAAAPSFLCMLIIASFFAGIRDDATVAAIFTGIRPAVAALIIASAWSLGVKAKLTWRAGCVLLAAALAVCLGRVSPAWVVLALAILGAFLPSLRAGMSRKEKADGK